MKKIKKSLVALLLSGAAVAATSCGTKITADTIVIRAADLGYGLSWLRALAKQYTEKTGVQIVVQSAIGQDGVGAIQDETASYAGRSDIFVGRPRSAYHSAIYEGSIEAANGEKYPCTYEDLSDIYSEPYEGETGKNTMKAKINPTYLEYLTVNDKQYAVPWANGFMSFARNVDLWNEIGMSDSDIPYTTNQMFATFDKIASKGKSALIYSRTAEYYTSIPNVWFGQYEGIDVQNAYKNGIGPSGQCDPGLFTYTGIKKALEVLENIADNEVNRSPSAGQYNWQYNWTHPSSQSLGFTDMQSYFYLGASVFCLDGTWLEIEMSKEEDSIKGQNVDFIKIPVLSAITDKMDIGDSDNTAGVYIASDESRDAKLAEIVQFVDKYPNVGDNATKPSGVTDEDVEIVREARVYNSVQGTDYDHLMMIPSWSQNKVEAKKFLKYIYSDEGLQIFYNTMEGHHLPAVKSTGDYERTFTLTPFRESANKILEEGHFSGFDYIAEKAKIFCAGNVLTNFTNGISQGNFFTAMRDDNVSAESIFSQNKNYLSDNWSTISGKIGL